MQTKIIQATGFGWTSLGVDGGKANQLTVGFRNRVTESSNTKNPLPALTAPAPTQHGHTRIRIGRNRKEE